MNRCAIGKTRNCCWELCSISFPPEWAIATEFEHFAGKRGLNLSPSFNLTIDIFYLFFLSFSSHMNGISFRQIIFSVE
ncbi:hypothetical protein LINPERHAP1_LOCUS6373 [Linum perenne]